MYTKHVKTKFSLALLLCLILCLVKLPAPVAAETELNFRWILPPEFYRGNDFHNNRAWVQREQSGPWTLFDTDGNVIKDGFMARSIAQSATHNTIFRAIENDSETGWDMFGFLDDYSGDILLVPKPYRSGDAPFFHDGIASRREENGLRGFIDFEGRWIILPIYENFFPMQDGLVPARKDGKWGIIDRNGEVVIDFRFEGLRILGNGLFVASYGEFYGLVNINGEWVTEAIYERFFRPHSPSRLIAAQKDGKIGYLDENGNVVIDFRFVGVGYGMRRGLQVHNGYFTFNDGRAVVFLPREEEASLPISMEQLIALHSGGRIADTIYKWVVINESGDIVPTEQYDVIWPFHGGLAPAIRDNRWFMLDTEGNEYPLPHAFVRGEVSLARSDDGRIFRAIFRNEEKTGYFRVMD